MRIYKKLGMPVFAFVLILLMTTSSFSQSTPESYQPMLVDSQIETSESTGTTDNDFEYYRNQVLAKLNMTQRDYDELTQSDKERVDVYANALRGYENGSLTQEEASAFTMPNSPMTVFAPGNILQFLDILHWWGYFYEFPTSLSVGRHDDEVFQIDFISRAMIGERICRRWVYWDKNPTLYDWPGYTMVSKWKGIASQYTSWNKPSTADLMSVNKIHELIPWTGSFRASAPTHFVGPIKLIFRYQYQWWDIWKNWPLGGWRDAECIYSIDRYWPALWPNLNVNDDDTNAPEISEVYVQNAVTDSNAEIPYIYDTTGILKFGGEALEGYVYPSEKPSKIGNVTLEIDGMPVEYSWSANNEHYWVPGSGDYRYSFAVLIPNPTQQLGIGTHSARICVYDGDTDRPNDWLPSQPYTLQFEIREEEIDTTPPHTTSDIEGAQGHQGWYTSDVYLILQAEDDLSGVETTMYSYDQMIWTEYTSPIPVTNQGTTTIYYQSIDLEGNTESVGSATVMIDKIAPVTSIISDGTIGNDGWYVSDVLVSLPSTDDGSRVVETYCRINQGTWMLYEEPFSLGTTGNHSIDYYSVDEAGNEEQFQTDLLKIDQTPPDTYILIQGTEGFDNWYTSEITVTLESDDSLFGSGVCDTFYSIDESSWISYTGPFVVDIEGTFSIDYYSTDLAGNEEDPWLKSVKIDTVAPLTEISFTGDLGLNNWYVSDVLLTLLPDDSLVGSGVQDSYFNISINSGEWQTYIEPILIDEDGSYVIEFYSTDVAGNTEEVKSTTLMVDTESPTSWLNYGPSFGDDPIYVTSSTEFEIISTDDLSGVAHRYFSINGGTWNELVDTFTIDGDDGEYSISYFSVDEAGNEEIVQFIIVRLTSLEIQTSLEDGDLNSITSFDNIFTKDKDSGGYRLVATNPGQIFYCIEISNTWPIDVSTLEIELGIPSDFTLKGAVPIHVYIDNIDLTSQCAISGTHVTINDLATGSNILIIVHLDYGLKGSIYSSLEEFGMKNYDFLVDIFATSTTLIGSYDSSSPLMAAQKKTTAIAGYVLDINGVPINDALVELYDSQGNLLTTTLTDENGFYYFIDLDVAIYTLKVYGDSKTFTVAVATTKNEMAVVICYL